MVKVTVTYPDGHTFEASLSEASVQMYQPYRSWYPRKPDADGMRARRVTAKGPARIRLTGSVLA